MVELNNAGTCLLFTEESFDEICGVFAGWFLNWLVLVCCDRKTLLAD